MWNDVVETGLDAYPHTFSSSGVSSGTSSSSSLDRASTGSASSSSGKHLCGRISKNSERTAAFTQGGGYERAVTGAKKAGLYYLKSLRGA